MLYSKYVPDYKDTLFNLCEPVLVNSIGLDNTEHGETAYPTFMGLDS